MTKFCVVRDKVLWCDQLTMIYIKRVSYQWNFSCPWQSCFTKIVFRSIVHDKVVLCIICPWQSGVVFHKSVTKWCYASYVRDKVLLYSKIPWQRVFMEHMRYIRTDIFWISDVARILSFIWAINFIPWSLLLHRSGIITKELIFVYAVPEGYYCSTSN